MGMETQLSAPVSRSFWLGKLFSLVGILPIGVYVFVHLYHNMGSLSGEAQFNQHLIESRSFPLIVPLTVLVIWIPIVFHGLYGLFVIKKARPNLSQYRYFENLKYVLQRLSGVGLLLFIPAHIYKTRIETYFENSSLDFHHMVEALHEPLTLSVYLLGVLGVAFHLANGVWQFSIGWGVAGSQKGMNRILYFSLFLFIVLLGMGYASIWGFWSS